MRILGVTIDTFSRKEILAHVETFLDEEKFHQIATINPEFLLEAEKNESFRAILERCDLRIADGFGIVLAGLLQGKYINRFAGADLMKEILKLANVKKLSVHLAVSKDGLSSFEEIQSALLKKYPDIRLEEVENCTIVLCNFGAPTQEIFLSNLRDKNNIRLAMGIGGSFDYLTGKKQRAPKWLRVIGLEWLWRLIIQPKRWKRIWNAVITFPFRVIFATIKK